MCKLPVLWINALYRRKLMTLIFGLTVKVVSDEKAVLKLYGIILCSVVQGANIATTLKWEAMTFKV